MRDRAFDWKVDGRHLDIYFTFDELESLALGFEPHRYLRSTYHTRPYTRLFPHVESNPEPIRTSCMTRPSVVTRYIGTLGAGDN